MNRDGLAAQSSVEVASLDGSVVRVHLAEDLSGIASGGLSPRRTDALAHLGRFSGFVRESQQPRRRW
jgi:hypothetical protein